MDPHLVAITGWWDAQRRELPWRASRDRYAIWISEVMSAQTQVARVVPYWERWMARWPDVDALAGASLPEVLAVWQGLGYPRRARDLHRAAQIVARDGWPDDLTALPGVGPYVAAAIRCFALEEPILPRDVNVNRVLARRFPAGLDIDVDPWRSGQAVMEFGQRVCTATPRCEECPVAAGCSGPGSDTKPARRQTRRFAGSLRQRRGALLRTVLAAGTVPVTEVQHDVAASLIADGLLARDGDLLRVPG